MGILYVVATPIGNMDDISKRCLDVLKSVDLIAVEDTRQTIKILNKFNIKKRMISYHKFNEIKKSEMFLKFLSEGKNIALVSDAGTPCISDPGYILVKMARKSGIEVFGIPGPSAVTTALSISGLDTSMFSFIGFLSTDNQKQNKELELMKQSAINTFVIYESPRRLKKTVRKLATEFSDAVIAICSDLTKLYERTFFGNISEVLEAIEKDINIDKGEYVIVIEKKATSIAETTDISLEAMIIDTMVKHDFTLKAAIKKISDEDKNIKKNDLYAASLKLKKILYIDIE